MNRQFAGVLCALAVILSMSTACAAPAAPPPASAPPIVANTATCDFTMSSAVEYSGTQVGNSSTTWNALPSAAIAKLTILGTGILDVASKQQGQKGANYSMVFGSSWECSDGTKGKTLDVQVDQLSLHGLAKIMRASYTAFDGAIKLGEQADAQGQTVAWEHKHKAK